MPLLQSITVCRGVWVCGLTAYLPAPFTDEVSCGIFMKNNWIELTKRMRAIARTGLTYSKNEFDLQRYREMERVSLEMMASYSDSAPEKVGDLFAGEEGYPTPKLDIRAAVFREDRLLMVREREDNRWALPGGWVEIGLTPSQAVVKEVREETGFEVVTDRLLAMLDTRLHSHPQSPHHIYKVFFRCEITGGKAETGIETSEVSFFARDDLPPLSVKRNTVSQLKMLFGFLDHPEQDAIFD